MSGGSAAVVEKEKEVVEADGSDRANLVQYPEPEAKLEDVIADHRLFMATLQKLHAAMGSKLRVPIIGGKELDLHHLFKEVVARGGYKKVITEKRWREVTASFTFPPTATNASFILRKYYGSLLHHYEQIFFFGSKQWNCPTTDFQRGLTAKCSEPDAVGHKRKKSNDMLSPANPLVVGVIDGKFESGYFVTVTVGETTMKGVIYPFSEESSTQTLPSQFTDSSKVHKGLHCRRKKKPREPGHPIAKRSGYNFFVAEQHARLTPIHPGKEREVIKMIGELWNKLSDTEKSVYQERGLKDKERYNNEMVIYRESLKAGPVISDAVPLQQYSTGLFVSKEETDPKMGHSLSDGSDSSTIGGKCYTTLSDSDLDSKTLQEESPDRMLVRPTEEKSFGCSSELQSETSEPKNEQIFLPK